MASSWVEFITVTYYVIHKEINALVNKTEAGHAWTNDGVCYKIKDYKYGHSNYVNPRSVQKEKGMRVHLNNSSEVSKLIKWLIQDVKLGNLAPECVILTTVVSLILQAVPLMEKK